MNSTDNEPDLYNDLVFTDPIDLVEYIAASSEWPVKRLSNTQALVLMVAGKVQYQILLNFDENDDVLRLTCGFSFDIKHDQKAQFLELLNYINTKTWIGNFTYDFGQQGLVFWYTMILPEGAMATPEQTYTLLNAAPEICQQFMPSFQAARKNDYTHAKLLADAWRKTEGNA